MRRARSKDDDEWPKGRGVNICCLCPEPTLRDDPLVIVYDPKKQNGYQTGRAHVRCFLERPYQNLLVMLGDKGLSHLVK